VFLTKRQSELLDYLRKAIAVQGYAPSLEEVAAHFQLSSVGTVHKHLRALEDKGVIRRQWNRSRAIEILATPDGRARRLPLLGRIAAGQALEGATGAESRAVPEDMLGRATSFVLEVRGGSLAGEHLQDKDVLVLEQREQPRNGDMVVLLVDGAAQVGTYSREGEHVELRSRDGRRAPLRLLAERCRIHGVVVGVLRHMRSEAMA
jgi:repressor LexA